MNIKTKLKVLGMRFTLLGVAIRHLFTGKDLVLQGGLSVSIAGEGLTVDLNVQRHDTDKWQHVAVTFDFVNPPKGYIDGRLLATWPPGVNIQAGGDVTIDSIRVRK